MFDVRVVVGDDVDACLLNPQNKCIQVIGQLMVLSCVGGWSPVVGSVLQFSPHSQKVVS